MITRSVWLKRFEALVIGAVLSVLSATMAVAQPSFDCGRASTATEHAICRSSTLSRLDSEMAAIYTAQRRSRSEAQRADFWTMRETIPEANRLIGAVASHDVSIPISEVPEFVRRGDALIAGMGDFRINAFGHLGDGNLHYNVFPAQGRNRAEYDDIRKRVQEAVHEMVVARGGSFSAEHGVGRLKVADLERWGDPARLAAMRAIKAALDPLGIMNPGAVLA